MQSLLDLHHKHRLVGLGDLSSQTDQAHSSESQVVVLMHDHRMESHLIVRADLVSIEENDFDRHFVLIWTEVALVVVVRHLLAGLHVQATAEELSAGVEG